MVLNFCIVKPAHFLLSLWALSEFIVAISPEITSTQPYRHISVVYTGTCKQDPNYNHRPFLLCCEKVIILILLFKIKILIFLVLWSYLKSGKVASILMYACMLWPNCSPSQSWSNQKHTWTYCTLWLQENCHVTTITLPFSHSAV